MMAMKFTSHLGTGLSPFCSWRQIRPSVAATRLAAVATRTLLQGPRT